ncbi:hypothetical protein V8C35DRAFT_290768 [Trichoderma chlorosporum]
MSNSYRTSFNTPTFTWQQVNEWKQKAPEEIRDPECLKDYWLRFNRMQMQMQLGGDGMFFRSAMFMAENSSSKNEFEEKLKERNEQRWAHIRKWYIRWKQEVWGPDGKSFPCDIARLEVATFCKTGSLDSLLRILDGIAYGWESLKRWRGSGPGSEPRSDDGLYFDWWNDFNFEDCSREPWFRHNMPPSNAFEDSSDEDSSVEDISVAEGQMPEAKNDEPESFESWLRRRGYRRKKNTEEGNPSKKRARFDDTAAAETENPPKKRVRFDDAAAAEGVASGPRIEKKARDSDDSDASNDSDVSNASDDGRQHKRQRVERWASSTPTSATSFVPSDNPPTDNQHEHPSATPEPAVVENTPKKRSRTADEDDDDEQYRHKRRRTETPESDMTATKANINNEDHDNEKCPHKRSRIETPESAPTRQATDESTTVAKANVDDKVKGSRKARSTRSAKSSTFWELDNTSSPRLTRKRRC